MQIGFPRENLMLSPKNTAFNEANMISSIKKENLHLDLVLRKERVPVVKKENNVNVGRLNCYSSEEEDDYFIEESQNEINFSPKKHVKTKPSNTDSEEEESISTFKNSKCNEKAIKEEYFVGSKLIVQEELDIKDEDETEDQFTTKSAVGRIRKRHHPRNGAAPLNRLSTNNRLTEPPVFKCLNCTYQTHRKRYIASHVLIHVEKPKLYQCPECAYKTKHRRLLMNRHMVIHQKDAPIHKCTLCPYEASLVRNLQAHMLCMHRSKALPLIHCQEDGCSFKTDHKPNLGRHIRLMHKWKRLLTCSKCSFQTKYPRNLKAHELRHENRNKCFSCTLCPYKTATKTPLRVHMIGHKSDSEVNWFLCSECPFKSIYRSSLWGHKLFHNLNSENIFKCSECSFNSSQSSHLHDHQLLHKKPEEISEWFHCYMCTWKTPLKRALSSHIRRRHRGSDGRIHNN